MNHLNKIAQFLKARRRLLVALSFVAFTVVFLNGVLYCVEYTGPMLAGNYEQAATYASPYNAPKVGDDPPPMPGLTEDDPWDTRTILWVMERYQRYTDTVVGNRALAAFDHGLALYEEYKFEAACSALQKAYASCCNSDGKILPEYRQLGSDIQLLIGNTFANRQKTEDAVAAYEVSLRLDPNNIVSTYNLEKLQDSDKGGGKSDKGDKPKPAGPPSPRTKI